jgi:hypothetical protein
MMNWKKITMILTVLLLGTLMAHAQVSFRISIGSGDYYQPVGDYDYLPYAYQTNQRYAAPRINFFNMMSQYGDWVRVAPFGQVWKPYVARGWRPYTYGHWVHTRKYGQMWEGYEPWAWVGYHYGRWIFTRNYRWVWIPGYVWHPGRVTWAHSYGSIGWMPMPPDGYDYRLGYLSNVGPNNQFSYNDRDFGANTYNNGGPYYNSQYRNMYYNQAYQNIFADLWNFIDDGHYGDDNYADSSLGDDYTRQVFDQRMVRISNRPIERPVLETFLGRQLQETPVDVRQFQTDRQAISVVVPSGSGAVERIRKNSKAVVRDILAPGFVEKRKEFKGQNSKNKEAVSGIFGQENVQPKIETLSSEQVINQANLAMQNRDQSRNVLGQAAKDKLIRFEKDKKIQETKAVDTRKLETDANAQQAADTKALKKANNLKLKQHSDATALKATNARKLETDANAQQAADTKALKKANNLKLKQQSDANALEAANAHKLETDANAQQALDTSKLQSDLKTQQTVKKHGTAVVQKKKKDKN